MSDITLDITESTTEVTLNIVRGSVTQVSGGEANTSSNQGGGYELAMAKSGVDLPFRTLLAGDYIGINESTDIITIKVDGYPNLFIAETDTPGSYAGASLKALRVNFDEDAIEFYTPSAGVSTFDALTDVPASKSGEALKGVRVNSGETALEYYDTTSLDSKIEDTAGTTYLDTEDVTYANQLIGKSPQTGIGLMLQMFEGSGTSLPTFQVQANGSILRDGDATVLYRSSNLTSVFIGTLRPHTNATNTDNLGAGSFSGASLTTGRYNVFFGSNTGILTTTGNYNVCIGYNAGRGNTTQSLNTYIGNRAGFSTAGIRNLFIGNQAGESQVSVNNKLILSGYEFASAAAELTNSIIVGDMAATPADQILRLNAKVSVNVAALTNQVAGDIQSGNCLIVPEITTPTADADYGKIYTKSDNKIYFQDGAGAEHEIAFV